MGRLYEAILVLSLPAKCLAMINTVGAITLLTRPGRDHFMLASFRTPVAIISCYHLLELRPRSSRSHQTTPTGQPRRQISEET